jgi:DNA-binding XRE family transcriptional regulator
MKAQKKKRIEAAGWRTGSVAEFLELTPEEAAFVELKLALADLFKQLRAKNRWTQSEAARRIKSSQSRVAKMEAGDPSVTMDLLLRSCLMLGASTKQVARAIASRAA